MSIPGANIWAYEDVFTKIDMYRAYFASCGLGADYVNQFIR